MKTILLKFYLQCNLNKFMWHNHINEEYHLLDMSGHARNCNMTGCVNIIDEKVHRPWKGLSMC